MTIVTTIAICLAVACAALLGRCGYISGRRADKIKKQKDEIKKLSHRLDRIADSSKYDRYYEIEEDELREAYAALIDRISGKGTWESNPFVFVYDFELVKE